MGKDGSIFLGNPQNLKRDGYYKSEGGNVDYDPAYECTGGSTEPADKRCPFQLKTPDAMDQSLTGWEGRLLHINLPSYRDPLCPRTLKYLFTKAKRPFDIRVRVLQQNVPSEDPPCLEKYCEMMADLRRETGGGGTSKGGPAGDDCPHRDQVYIHPIHAKEAAGPTYARGLLGQDIREAYEKNELSTQDFCMSTDSHMDFEPEWDQKMVDMWDLAVNEYAVLSTYVANIDQLGKNLNGSHEVPHLCMVVFTSQVRTHATKCAHNLSKPKLTNVVWGAGLSFSKCHAELKVPVDPHTPGVFDGEEFNRAARFWTYGYDIYTPHRVYVLHDYPGSQHNPKTTGWGHGDFSPAQVKNAHYRLNTMLDVPGGERDYDKALQLKKSKYGLGDRRSLDDLIQFSGIDLRHKKVTIDGKNRCGNLQWVPFTENPKGVNYIPKFDEDEQPLDVPYEKTSVWYDPHVDGAGAGLVSRRVKIEKEDPAEVEIRRVAEEAAHDAHKKEAEKLAGSSLHEDHKALAAALEAEGGGSGGHDSQESDHREVISNAAAAALKAEQMDRDGVKFFPPLLRGKPGGIPKGRFFFSPVKLSKHGVENLPIQVKLSVFAMVLGICFAIIASGGDKRKRRANSKKSG
mmetsp:Transcript_28980/g.61712  ORF Transcript_28980/g.61712 Transcript_28980/m.61712 type:complete len:627 (+) Transcript_28980:44-1924(+)